METLLTDPNPFVEWLWTEPSWIHLTHGDMLLLGGLIGTGVIVGIINWIRTGENGFF